jgi:hypothetical protein
MIGINFQKWNSHHTNMFNWYRVFWNYKWTPFIWAMPRYNSEINAFFYVDHTAKQENK